MHISRLPRLTLTLKCGCQSQIPKAWAYRSLSFGLSMPKWNQSRCISFRFHSLAMLSLRTAALFSICTHSLLIRWILFTSDWTNCPVSFSVVWCSIWSTSALFICPSPPVNLSRSLHCHSSSIIDHVSILEGTNNIQFEAPRCRSPTICLILRFHVACSFQVLQVFEFSCMKISFITHNRAGLTLRPNLDTIHPKKHAEFELACPKWQKKVNIKVLGCTPAY